MQKLIEVNAAKEFADTFYANDPILKYAANSLLDNAPAADVDKLTSAEKQAIFRLGQMDMRESILTAIREAAGGTGGVVHGTLIAAEELVERLEVLNNAQTLGK